MNNLIRFHPNDTIAPKKLIPLLFIQNKSKLAEKMAKKETPLMKQYNSIKAKYPDALLLFRVGDFYETFGEDAVRCAKILDIVLTKRANGAASHIELAGFPHHALDTYLPKLVKAGLRVAICDQLEDPKQTKTIVKRGVTELVTPGLAMNDQVLSAKSNNFLMALHSEKNRFGMALLDISTGEFLATEGDLSHLKNILSTYQPSEVIHQKFTALPPLDFPGAFKLDDWAFQTRYGYEQLSNYYKTNSLKGFGLEEKDLAVAAAGAVFAYLEITHHQQINHLRTIHWISPNDGVWLDTFTIRNLELVHPMHHEATTLLDIIDYTQSPMGGRLLRRWMLNIPKDLKTIHHRQQWLKALWEEDTLRFDIQDELSQMADIERLLAKLSTGKISPKQLHQLMKGLKHGLQLKQRILGDSTSDILLEQAKKIHDLDDLIQLLETQLSDDPPHLMGKGEVIRAGVHAQLDEIRNLKANAKGFLENMRLREEERSQIPNLKIAFNNVFGYYIEVRNTHKDKVPEDWIRKQTLVNAERYITEELKEYESQILGAEEKMLQLEQQLFQNLMQQCMPYMAKIQENAQQLAQWDVLAGWANLAVENHYTLPKVTDGKAIHIEEGRHPVIEKNLPPDQPYIANSVTLDTEKQQIMMITGPNMSGKSALLRQTALITLMAQMGCAVPAKHAEIGLVDSVFTRVGASDNLSAGESTFMVEMNETAGILNQLSERSLILLDEIGRGTSTFDGISIAWAITEYLHEHRHRPKTLFATHYHELNEMTHSFPRIKNYSVSIKELKDNILFMRKLVPGGSEHSFGIHVAKMAGVPSVVVNRANEILAHLEKNTIKNNLSEKQHQDKKENMQLSFFQLDDPVLEAIRDEILHTDINSLTPVEALMKLNEIKKKLV